MPIERPLLSKQDILTALDPTGNAGESAFRRLKRDGFISSGIQIKPRRKGHVEGTLVVFCSLNRDAATAYRKEMPELALRIAARARKVESSRAARRLAKLVSLESQDDSRRLDLDGLYGWLATVDPRPADELAYSVQAARDSWEKALRELRVMTVTGILTKLHGETAEIDTPDGRRYYMPIYVTSNWDRMLEAAVSIRQEQLGDGSLWTLVERAWSDIAEHRHSRLPELKSPDPFAVLRPHLPDNLEQVLDEAPSPRPLALIGPRLAWQ